MKMAIVGAGLSGATLVNEFVNHPTINKLQIDVYEPRDLLCVGQAYQPDTDEAILNLHAQDVSVKPDDPSDALKWLDEYYPSYANPHTFLPRSIYGEYLIDRLGGAFKHPHVHVIQHDIKDLKIDGTKYYLQSHHELWSDAYDAVFLCIGHPPYADYYELAGQPNFIQNPFPIQEKLQHIHSTQRVGIIGTSLSAMDALKFLVHHTQFDEPVQLLSHINIPFNSIKKPRDLGEIYSAINHNWIDSQVKKWGHLPLNQFIKTLKSDLKENQIDLEQLKISESMGSLKSVEAALEHDEPEINKLQSYIVYLNQFFPDLYQALTPSDRDRYEQDYAPKFNRYLSQIPAESFDVFFKAYHQGQVNLVSNIQSIDIQDDKNFLVTTQENKQIAVDLLINTAGFEFDVTRAAHHDPFVKNLYDREIITPYYRGGIHVSWPNCEVIRPRSGRQPNLYLLGHWISKIQYANNNILLIQQKARELAQNLINQL